MIIKIPREKIIFWADEQVCSAENDHTRKWEIFAWQIWRIAQTANTYRGINKWISIGIVSRMSLGIKVWNCHRRMLMGIFSRFEPVGMCKMRRYYVSLICENMLLDPKQCFRFGAKFRLWQIRLNFRFWCLEAAVGMKKLSGINFDTEYPDRVERIFLNST